MINGIVLSKFPVKFRLANNNILFAGNPYEKAQNQDIFIKSDNSVNETQSIGNQSNKVLTPSNVLKKLNDQLLEITPEEINQVVESFDKDERLPALKVLRKLTQYGNINSLNSIYDDLIEQKRAGYIPYKNSDASLIDNLYYLYVKKAFASEPAWIIDDFSYIRGKGSILLDGYTLEKIERDQNVVKILVKRDVRLLYPESWENGINPFNLTDLDDIKNKTERILKRAKEIQSDSGIELDKAISEALNEPIKNRLKKLGLEDHLQIITNKKIDSSSEPTPEDIAKQLAPNKMSEEQFLQVLPKSQYSLDGALELLNNDGKVISLRQLALISKDQHAQIINIAKNKQIPENRIFYFVEKPNKSFGLTTMLHKLVNNIPENQIVTDIDQLPKDDKSKMVVVLEDYSGTGDRLMEVHYYLRNKYKGDLVIAPSITNANAAKKFRKLEQTDKSLNFLPGKVMEGFIESDRFKKLDSGKRYGIYSIAGNSGYCYIYENIVFPYMSPDNNTAFFADNIARFYTFNNAGVKPSDNNSDY